MKNMSITNGRPLTRTQLKHRILEGLFDIMFKGKKFEDKHDL